MVVQNQSRMRWKLRRALGILLIALATLIVTSCSMTHQYTGTVLEPAMSVADFTLTDQHGQPFQLSAQRGKITLLYFGYTHCRDFCPTTMGDWMQIKRQLGVDADKVRFVMISVDPERDTEQALKTYLERFDPAFVGLRPTAEQLAALSREYGVGVNLPTAGGAHGLAHHNMTDPTMHGTYFYAIDQAGQYRILFHYGDEPARVAADLKQLLRSS